MYPVSSATWDAYRNGILDHGFNAAVLHIAQRLFPGGFDVSEDAPDTYEGLVALFESGRRYRVFSGGSERTIYGDPEVNYHFRAWHDWCHWRGRCDFSLKGEYGAYQFQCTHVDALYGESDTTARWKRILYAEVIGQKIYEQRYGRFPKDQMAFARRFLADPHAFSRSPAPLFPA
jgi:hypothetical protein